MTDPMETVIMLSVTEWEMKLVIHAVDKDINLRRGLLKRTYPYSDRIDRGIKAAQKLQTKLMAEFIEHFRI